MTENIPMRIVQFGGLMPFCHGCSDCINEEAYEFWFWQAERNGIADYAAMFLSIWCDVCQFTWGLPETNYRY